MDLSLFCDTYIIAEYHRLKAVLDNMPRYRFGTHNGIQIVRVYSGTGKDTVCREISLTGRYAAPIKQKHEQYLKCQKDLEQFKYELYRRHLPVPNGFRFIRDPSPFDVNAWNQFKECSNPYEVNTEYYDDFGYNVRSRGEMILGNALKELGLEVKYEPSLKLKGSRRKSPDYSFPLRILDRCFFVEFIGQTDKQDYLDSIHGKFDEYLRNGILPNRDLILICGTEKWIPSQESMKRIISAFINNAVLSTYTKVI